MNAGFGRRARAVHAVAMSCAALALAGAILSAIPRYSVNVPFWDLWDYVRQLRLYDAGEVSWLELLFARAGEHQIGMELIMSAAAWRVTGMNMPAIMVWNWITAVLFCVLARSVTRRALPGSTIAWTVFAAAAFFVFNPAAYQVWLWALPLVHLLVPLFFLAGIWLAQGRVSERVKLLAAGILATAGSFLLASGLLLWLLFPLALYPWLKRGVLRRERLATAVCLALMAASLGAYAHGFLTGGGASPVKPTFDPAVLARFFLAYTGNLVSLATAGTPVAWAELAGLGLTLYFAIAAFIGVRRLQRTPRWPAFLIWACVGALSLAGGALATLGRHGFGVAYAVESSRYVLASSFLPLACVAIGCILAAGLAAELPRRRQLYRLVLCGTVALALSAAVFRVLQAPRALACMRQVRAAYMAGKVAALAANLMDLPHYREIYPAEDRVELRLSANFLNRRGWLRPPMWDSRFVANLGAPALRPDAAFGRLEEAGIAGGKLRLSGWAYLAGRKEAAHATIAAAIDAGGGARMLAVFTRPAVDARAFSGEVPVQDGALAGSTLRCFAYDGDTGEVHLLAGERRL